MPYNRERDLKARLIECAILAAENYKPNDEGSVVYRNRIADVQWCANKLIELRKKKPAAKGPHE